MVQDLCERIRKLQLDFKSVDSLTHESIFSSIHPTVAKMYKKAFDKTTNSNGAAYERFNEVTNGSYDKLPASPSQKALISPTLGRSGPTEITMTKKTGADVLKSAKVKASVKYSPSKQLEFIVDFMSEGDENTKWAKELLNNGQTEAFTHYLEGLSTAFREKFINTYGQEILLACKDDDSRQAVENTICEALYQMNGFRTLNLSHIRSTKIYSILSNNRRTLESVILQYSSIPSLYNYLDNDQTGFFRSKWFFSKDLAEEESKKRPCLRKLKYID